MDAQEILDNLDARCFEWFEPIINPDAFYFRVADARMTVFRSTQQWVLFFERVGFNTKVNEYEVDIYAYGNCLQEYFEGGGNVHLEYIRHPFEFDTDATPINPDGYWILDLNRLAIWINGTRLELTPTPDDYNAAGISFDEEHTFPGTIQPDQLLRFLCHHLDHPFFNSEDYLRFVIDTFQSRPSEPVYHQTGLSHHLSLFLQTQEWQHPDFDKNSEYSSEYECPSDVPGFHILARAIASGDLTEWNAQNPATFNTDWRPWEAIRIAERAQLRKQAAERHWSSDGSGSFFVQADIVETPSEKAAEEE